MQAAPGARRPGAAPAPIHPAGGKRRARRWGCRNGQLEMASPATSCEQIVFAFFLDRIRHFQLAMILVLMVVSRGEDILPP